MIITKPYSIKHISGNKARIYISLQSLLSAAGMKAGSRVVAEYQNSKVTVRKAKNNEQAFAVLATSRGAILEIRNTDLKKAMGKTGTALVSASKKGICITPHPTELKRLEREERFKRKLKKGLPLKAGSLFSGIGLLPLHLHDGLQKTGIKVKMALASDINEKSLDLSYRCNPIWDDADTHAKIVCGDLRDIMNTTSLPSLDILDISYPCNGQSTLAKKDARDTQHPMVGDLFIDVVSAIRATSPALVVIECTPAFNKSDTLRLIEKSLSDYMFKKFTLNGADHGSIENRSRACVIGISKGISGLLEPLATITPKKRPEPRLGDFLENIADDSSLWKPYNHVISKLNDDRLDFKHYQYTPESNRIATIVATYQSPKIGSPFIAHPTDSKLMRLITPTEHATIKRVPDRILTEIQNIVSGNSPITSKRGSKTLAHNLLGLSVDKYPWIDVGGNIGQTIISNLFDDLLIS